MNRKQVRAAIAKTLTRAERKRLQGVRGEKALRPSARAKLQQDVIAPALKRLPKKRASIQRIEGAT